MLGIIDLEPDGAHALPQSVRRAEQPCRFAVTAGSAGQRREALENIGKGKVRLDVGSAGERPVCVAIGLLGVTLQVVRHPSSVKIVVGPRGFYR
ncbi:hypothetical protein [Mycobacterium sp. AZCC_0083]|uniref:hypothetical protein n=1 Tax=Mycobacterium sp. AZCC_0083 TaxID=2735882 RepID=UPI0016132B55|nr:hypothetical protein [Mycobacterium sp. AZCC_0083]MBB5160416.1 hypothetical protein [Mycobacterium sp. AZCC_0083]